MRSSSALVAFVAAIFSLTPSALAIVTTNPSQATSRSFDYVIVGGGLAGMVAANRLSADSNVNVLVIESGADTRNDDRIKSLDAYSQVFSPKDINWAFPTTDGKQISAGRGLGGSTSINGGAITRGDVAQFDNIGKLGNAGWDYSSLLTYMKKSENFIVPNSAQVNAGAQYNASAHGSGGPVTIRFGDIQGASRRSAEGAYPRFAKRFYTGPYQRNFVQAIKKAIGTDQVADLSAGHTNGVAFTPNSMLRGPGNLRSSSAIAYLNPVENRPNLVVLTTWRGWKINWASGSGTPTATGVVIQQSNGGTTYNVKATREVIVAAGAIRSPVFLEHSGIGDPSVLSPLNIPVKVNLPGVGRNLQEQTQSVFGAAPKNRADLNGQGPSNLIAMPSASQLMSNATAVRSYVESNFQRWAQDAVDAGGAVNIAGLIAQWKLTTSALFDSNVGAVEMFVDSGYPNNGFGVEMWPLLPFSRGTVHTSSASTFAKTIINPRYFSVPFDMDMQVAGCRAVRRIFQTSPVSDLFENGENLPGFDASQGGIPDGPNKGAYWRWQNWINSSFNSVAHPIGTCQMAPQAQGGVVDPNFKVYGTANVRVIDASVLPQQLSAHLSANLYGVAERAAAVIAGKA
ncbi:hypothetical protein OC844_003980 [Tilletia horrida]|nr:hypothetical protein OC844_003980 [Tilletia horrida]